MLLGGVSFLLARSEERHLTEVLSQRFDLREFVTGWPMRIGPDAIRIGGRIFIILGMVVFFMGIIFLFID